MEQKDNYFFMVSSEELQKETEPVKEGALLQEIADQAFQTMLLENELTQQKQAMADLEFNLMMGGVI